MNQIRKYLLAYVSSNLSFDQFWEWFAEISIDAASRFSGTDLEMVREIALSVAEYTGGSLSEPALKADIRKYAGLGSSITLVYEAAPRVTTAASPSSLFERQLAFG